MTDYRELFEEKIIPKLIQIFNKDGIFDIEMDENEITFQTWMELSGGHDGPYEYTLPLAKLKNLCMYYGFVYIISGTGDSDTPNRLKVSLIKK